MTKKDYELTAYALNRHNIGSSQVTIEAVAYTLAELYAQNDKLFNRSKFLQACGLEV